MVIDLDYGGAIYVDKFQMINIYDHIDFLGNYASIKFIYFCDIIDIGGSILFRDG